MKLPLLAVAVAVVMAAGSLMVQGQRSEPAPERAVDPVCGIAVRKDPALSFEHGGVTYYFCMNADLEAFRKDPAKFLDRGEHRHPDPAAD